MTHITILTVGKLKEEYWKSAEAEYLKRLRPYIKFEFKELKEEKFDEKSNREIIKQKEAEKILSALPKDSYTIALDKNGKQFSSEQLADHIHELQQLHHYTITLIIGGPHGLDTSVLQKVQESWSFSQLTFTHQMMRVILLEQLYRSVMIQKGKSYHY